MILFEQISYKNFLASGNTPIRINISDHDTTLIVGQNGAGKSTIIEAIVFALFNKSFRKINKSQLVNSINEKDKSTKLMWNNFIDFIQNNCKEKEKKSTEVKCKVIIQNLNRIDNKEKKNI